MLYWYHQSLYLKDNLQKRRTIAQKYIKGIEKIKNISILEISKNNFQHGINFLFCDKSINPNF